MFDLRRFLRLAAVHRAEHGRAILWFLGIGIAVHFCVWLLFTQGGGAREHYANEMQSVVFVAGYLLTAPLFAGRHFAALSDRGSALTLLMRPASTFEKFLLAFLVVAVFYPLAYTLAFQVVNLPGAALGETARDALVAVESAKPDGGTAKYLGTRDYSPYLPFAGGRMTFAWELNLLLATSALQALVVVGSLYFRRLAWLKTLVALFALVVLVVPLLSVLFGGSIDRLFLDGIARASEPWLRTWLHAMWVAMPALFWASAFFFLRERELS